MNFLDWLGYRFEWTLKAIGWVGENFHAVTAILLTGILIGMWIV